MRYGYQTKPRVKKGERGFALLLIFLLASAVALTLYRQMPREAFESERDKEQMLIDRGEQYKRAIYLFYTSNNRQWPSKIEDLENTNSHRYLRHRYVNPYTGKDEWRLVHTNGTFLTDSLVTPPPAQATPGAPGSSPPLGGTGTLASSPVSTPSSTDPNAPPEINAQVQRRPSDRTLVENSNFQNQPGGVSLQGNDPGYQPFNPASLPPISLYPNGYNAAPTGNLPGANGPVVQPGFNQPGINQLNFNQPGVNQPVSNQPVLPNQPGVPGFTIPGTNTPITTPGVNPVNFNPTNGPGVYGTPQPGNPNLPVTGVYQPGTPGPPFPAQQFPGQDPNQPNVGGFNSPVPVIPGVPGVPGAPGAPGVPGVSGMAPSNQAVNLITQLLTTPRQPPTTVGQNPPTSGGGLAGVASVYKGVSIKSYGDRTKYQEWEFVFQLSPQGGLQAPQGAGPNGKGGPGTGGPLGAPGAPGAPGGTTPGGGTAPGGNNSSFGNN